MMNLREISISISPVAGWYQLVPTMYLDALFGPVHFTFPMFLDLATDLTQLQQKF